MVFAILLKAVIGTKFRDIAYTIVKDRGVVWTMNLSEYSLPSLVIKALCKKYMGKTKNGVDNLPHPACAPYCPFMDQTYVLSEGHRMHIEKGKEVKHDFVLEVSSFKDCGTLSGRVKDKHGHPIDNALVKVFDLNLDPITHVFTNNDGEFVICLPPGHYLVKAVH